MLFEILTNDLDLWGFAIVVLASAVLAQVGIQRQLLGVRIPLKAWLGIFTVLVAGILVAMQAGHQERARLQEMIAGFAPTYAEELSRMGHERMTSDTSADDPQYLAMIEAQLRWQRANPFVADIYTYGKRADGKIVLLVDAETDYDRNGVFEGDRESRTAIGEVYEEDKESIEQALRGESVFGTDPVTDRWGTWVSSLVPMRGADGKVIAALGVDYPADLWIRSILWHRGAMLGLAIIVAGVLITSSAITTLMRGEIQKRKQTEAALRASETRLRTILDSEPESVIVVDSAGIVREINPAGLRVLEGDAPQVLGKALADFVKPEHRNRVKEHHRQVLGGEASVLEFEFVSIADHIRHVWMETHSVPLRDEDGKAISVLCVARDVSARKQVEAEREALQKEYVIASRQAGMAEVAANVLHNVGNVLNSVNVSAGLISDRLQSANPRGLTQATALMTSHDRDLPDYLSNDEIGKQIPPYLQKLAQCLAQDHEAATHELDRLKLGVEHIKEIVNRQQSFAKGSNLVLPVRPADLVAEAIQLNITSLERHEIQLVQDLEELPELPLDRHKILQVLVNLISNAKAAALQGPRTDKQITLRLRRGTGGQTVQFEVADNGTGIEPQHMNQLFIRGFTTKPLGSGFGLPASADAATEMGGCLTAHTDGPGLGARFVLELPITLPADMPAFAGEAF